MNALFIRGKHYALDLERAILGACMLEQDAYARVMAILQPEYFYHDAHEQLYRAMTDMYRAGLPIDMLTVRDQLVRVGSNYKLGGETEWFIISITRDVCQTAHLEYWSWILKQMWMEREVIRLTHGGNEKLDGSVKEQVEHLRSQLDDILVRSTVEEWDDMTTLMVKLYQHQEDMQKSAGIGISCGIKKLDKANGGFYPGQMIVLGARPSVGKSAFAALMSLHMAMNKKKVGIISLEMNNIEIAARLAALHTETDFSVLYRGLYADEVQTKRVYTKIARDMPDMPIFVSDQTSVNAIEIKAKAQKLRAQYGLDILFIDYLQLIEEQASNRTRENEIARISRHCKVMAKEMKIPVVLLCQLSREVEKRKGEARFPQLSDLRESGAIEQDADVVMFLHRDWISGIEQNDDGKSTEHEAHLIVRKWRNGMSNFKIKMHFHGQQMKFSVPDEVIGYRPVELKDFTQSQKQDDELTADTLPF